VIQQISALSQGYRKTKPQSGIGTVGQGALCLFCKDRTSGKLLGCVRLSCHEAANGFGELPIRFIHNSQQGGEHLILI
jgi:hypothetical protein